MSLSNARSFANGGHLPQAVEELCREIGYLQDELSRLQSEMDRIKNR